VDAWNIALFSWLNAPEQPPPLLLAIARGTAESVIYAVALWLVLGWLSGKRPFKAALLNAGLAAALGLGINQLIGLAWYHPRPFELGLGHQFLAHGVETSFPSDHATVLWALGLSLVGRRSTRAWGIVVSLLGVAVAWSRVYLGVHFPFDMLGSLGVAVVSVLVLRWIDGVVAARIFPPTERLYQRLIRALHLPPRLFPPE